MKTEWERVEDAIGGTSFILFSIVFMLSGIYNIIEENEIFMGIMFILISMLIFSQILNETISGE